MNASAEHHQSLPTALASVSTELSLWAASARRLESELGDGGVTPVAMQEMDLLRQHLEQLALFVQHLADYGAGMAPVEEAAGRVNLAALASRLRGGVGVHDARGECELW